MNFKEYKEEQMKDPEFVKAYYACESWIMSNNIDTICPHDKIEEEYEDNTGEKPESFSQAYGYLMTLLDSDTSMAYGSICHDESIANRKVTVTGVVGRWDGTHEIVPATFDTIKEAIDAVVYNDSYEKTYTLRRLNRWEFDYVESHHDSNATHFKLVVEHKEEE